MCAKGARAKGRGSVREGSKREIYMKWERGEGGDYKVLEGRGKGR